MSDENNKKTESETESSEKDKMKVSFQDDKKSHENAEPMDHEDVIFYFFYGLVEKMILKRTDVGDICTLSSWLKALERTKSKTIRNEYIKLMTIALQYSEPMCPFKDHPSEPIDPLENEVLEMAKKFISREGTATCVGQNELEMELPNPTISTAVSHDRCQYAACQYIPDSGVQCYFAYSDDPIYYWLLPPQITVPAQGPHATDLDWERTMAGITAEAISESMEQLLQKKSRNNKNDKEDDEIMSVITSNKFFKKKGKENEDPAALCNVMNVEQVNRNVTEEFGWNEGSVLTGAIILGAEECSDRKIDAQVNTQLAIDEDVASVHERLYPGDFEINVHPSVIGNVIPMKREAKMTCDEKNGQNCQTPAEAENAANSCDKHKKASCDSTNPNENRRQCAGQENDFRSPEKSFRDDCATDRYHKKHKITELSSELTTMKMTTDLNNYSNDRRQVGGGPPKNLNSLFESASVDCLRVVNMAKESFDDIHATMRSKRNVPKTGGQNPKTYNDSKKSP